MQSTHCLITLGIFSCALDFVTPEESETGDAQTRHTVVTPLADKAELG